MDINTYDAQADTIDVDDITTNSNNRIVLRRIKRNDANDEDNECLSIQNVHYSVGGDYVPEGADDMGWLGYFVGKNEHLKRLHICPWFTPTSSGSSVRDMLVPFFRGVNLNKSIREIGFYQIDLLGGETFTCWVHSSKTTTISPTSLSVDVIWWMRDAVCLHWQLGVVPTNL